MTNRIEKMFYKMNRFNKNIKIKIKKELRYEKTIIINNNKLIDIQDNEFIELDNYNFRIDKPNDFEYSSLSGSYILIGEITFDSEKNDIFYYDMYVYLETNSPGIYDINGEAVKRNNKTKEEIILFFNKFLQDEYPIITLFCSYCYPDDDDFTDIINRYLNDKLNNSNTNFFNYLDEDSKFKLIYRNHKNKKSLFI